MVGIKEVACVTDEINWESESQEITLLSGAYGVQSRIKNNFFLLKRGLRGAIRI